MDVTFSSLEEITNGFSKVQQIGSGAFGEVYKGVLDGDEIVVKKLFPMNGLDDIVFENEFRDLMNVQHENIIRFIGYCSDIRQRHTKHNGKLVFTEVMERALCCEYMQGGSLVEHISDESCIHDWPITYGIIKGICWGLHHLHRGQKQYIYHLDLKLDNVLLDKNMVPKIGDFGFSRLFGASTTHQVSTTRGTTRFMSPEYINNRIITPKNDVFSLGVIIFHIMAGEKGYKDYCDLRFRLEFSQEDHHEFIEKVQQYWKRKMQATEGYKWVETDLLGVTKCMEMAMSCVDTQRVKRRTTEEIIDVLKNLDAEIEKMSRQRGQDGHKWIEPNILDDILLDPSAEPISLSLAFLQHITDNFADERKIAQGGFAIVYKGVLKNGSVAVKKLLNSQTIEDGPFYREATFLMSVKHQNVVRFLGYCAHTENQAIKVGGSGKCERYIYPEIRERLLCFEYVSKGGLDNHLTDELRGLDWHTRYQIIKGICKGLQYLHTEKDIVHMDLKPANILLDDIMTPKITDFGISKHLDGISQAFTEGRHMSLGYCAPEYHRGQVSFKSDIFSLGVIITDLVTGRKEDPDVKNVLRRWRYRWSKSSNYPPLGYEQVTKCIEIALGCTSFDPKVRPYIWDVISVLNSVESTSGHINCTSESTDGTISPYAWELLEMDPLELHFPFQINEQIPCSLELTNVKDDYIAFHIRKWGMLKYCIEPDKGVVPPHSKCGVIITLQAQKKAPHVMVCKDELFVVRCAILNEGLKAENVTDHMFDEKLGKVVDEVTLTVVF